MALMAELKRILIVGESCRDVFIYCDTHRLAPDIPVPVLQVTKQTDNPGMAKNVERNVRAIHQACELFTNPNWRRVTKTRFMHERSPQAFFRVDHEPPYPKADVKKIPLKKYDIIGISDYNKGFLSHEDIQYICENHPFVFVDTKKPIGSFVAAARYIKINKSEYERSLPISKRIDQKIIVTKGGEGADFQGKNYPVETVEVRDLSGAGDSFFAALIVHYAKSSSIEDAIRFANACAMRVVQKRGVSVIDMARTPRSLPLTRE